MASEEDEEQLHTAEEDEGEAGGAEEGHDDEADDQDAANPPLKRQRLGGGEDFKVGTVKRIKVHNFMTYAGTVTITPGPRLNLVLGPNGTGKSSLVCALCIGLAGSPKRLGRADNLGDFVRRNCNSCWTEITLSGGGAARDVVIRRTISLKFERDTETNTCKRSYASDFQINGVPTSQKEVQAKVASFNIQFDNLCQFLPQDMVVEFARMNAQELLSATMKALGDSQLERDHDRLINMRIAIKEAAADLGRKETWLQDMQAQHQAQHRDYERYAQRERLLAEVKLIKHKLQWLEVVHNQDMLKEAKEKFNGFKQAYEELASEAQDEDGPVKKLDVRCKALESALRHEQVAAQAAESRLLRLNNEIDDDKQRIDNEMNKIQNLHAESDKQRADIARLLGSVQAAEAELAKMPVGLPEELLVRRQELQAEQQGLFMEVSRAEEEEQEHRNQITLLEPCLNHVNNELSKLGNVRHMRLQRLDQHTRKPGVMQMFQFVQNNRSHFRGPVYGPIGVEIDIKDSKWAPFVENQCGGQLLNYCVTCEEDEMLLSNFMSTNNFSFPIYSFTGNYHTPLTYPLGDASAYRQYGVVHTLDQTFEAPSLIKHVLARYSNINLVYIGEDELQQKSEVVFNTTRVRSMFTRTQTELNKLSKIVSRHNQDAVYTSYDFVRPAERLGSGPAASEADNHAAARHAERAQLAQKLSALRAQLESARQRAMDSRSRHDRAMQGLDQIQHKKREIDTLRARKETSLSMERNRLAAWQKKPDPMVKEPQLRQQLKALLDNLYTKTQRQVELLEDVWNKTKRTITAGLAAKEADVQLRALRHATKARGLELRSKKAEMEKWKGIVDKAKETFESSKAEANRVHPRSPEVDEKCRELPDDEGELGQLQTQRIAEAQSIICNDENVIHEYKRRRQRIDDLSSEVAAKRSEVDQQQAELDDLKSHWLPELQELVAHINNNFSRSFEQIACAGEVALREHDDFEKYAIEIRVKFRDGEPLQLLTANRQSGGERSVSTILYLIALQEVTFTPFRVVDEINQGMDPVNERKVFAQLVESSCQPGTPQCFLLTPKLLPGLPMGDGITVLNIMNGPSIDSAVLTASNRGMGAMLYGRRWEDHQQQLAVAAS